MPLESLAEFYLGVWTEDSFFYIPNPTTWGVSDDPGSDGDLSQGRFYPNIIEEWLLPLDESYGHIKETSNPTELKVIAKDLGIEAKYVQYGRRLWIEEEPPEDD